MAKRYRRIEMVSPATPAPMFGGPLGLPRALSATSSPGFGTMSAGRAIPNATPIASGMDRIMPILARGIDVRVFEDFQLSTVSGGGGTYVRRVFSDALPVFGNAMTVGLTVQQSSGASTVTCTLQASIERRVWTEIDNFSQADFGYAEHTFSGFYFPWLRIALELTGTAQVARVDVDLSMARW